MRAIIVGAGIAGLAAALRLNQAGWETLVIERAPRRRDGGYLVSFGGIGLIGAERIGVLDGLTDRAQQPSELAYYNVSGHRRFALSGDTIAAMAGNTFNILRGDIESVLYEAVKARTTIRFGTTVTAISQDEDAVQAVLSDGAREEADLLIGADGLHSSVRSMIFGPDERYEYDMGHKVAVYMLHRRPDGLAEHAGGSVNDGGRVFALNGASGGRAVAFFGFRTDRFGADDAVRVEDVLPNLYGDMGWLVPDALAGLRTAESIYFDNISQITVDRWSKGRVVLAGDAAWCVTLFAGYGSSLAVGGVEALGSALAEHPDDITSAVAAWERDLRPTIEQKQKLARRVKGFYAPRNRLALEMTQLPLRLSTWSPARHLIEKRFQTNR